MINQIKTLFIFTLILLTHISCVDTDGVIFLKEKFSKKSFCINRQNYDLLIKDTIALKYYVDNLCSQVNPRNAKQHILQNYGTKTKKMGEGSFGAVYKYEKGNEKFAIKVPSSFEYKVLFKELNGSECIKASLNNNAELDNMAYITECVRPVGRNPHLIMKFFSFTLKQNIDSKYGMGWSSLKSTQKTKLVEKMYKLAKELEALHLSNLAHRDLKPDNIMVTGTGSPVLVDFGLLNPNGDNANTVCGTPYFIDYELLNRNGSALPSDVYAMLMTYVYMFHGKKGYSVLENILNKGNYVSFQKRIVSEYTPSFKNCLIPQEFDWMRNMFIPIKSGRWTITEVRKQFEKHLGIVPTKQDQVPVTPAQIEDQRQTPQMVERKEPIQKIEVERKEPVKKIEVERKEPVKQEHQNANFDKKPLEEKRGKYANLYIKPQPVLEKTEYQQKVDNIINKIQKDLNIENKPKENFEEGMFLAVGKDPKIYRNNYIIRKEEVNVKESLYYNPEKNMENPVRAQVLNLKNKRAKFDQDRNVLDKMIQDAMEERKIQKLRMEAIRNNVGGLKKKKMI